MLENASTSSGALWANTVETSKEAMKAAAETKEAVSSDLRMWWEGE